jgi:hypothetical protein
MRLVIRDSNTGQREIELTDEEARKVEALLLRGAEFLKLGKELINARYIIGIFEDPKEQQVPYYRRLEAPKEYGDFRKIKELIQKLKNSLLAKGIL